MNSQLDICVAGRTKPSGWCAIVLFLGATLMNLNSASAGDWKSVLSERLPLYGHRNWIVIADAAFPAQTSPGIETIACNDSHIDIVRGILGMLAGTRHVRPVVYIDSELAFLSEKDAPGIGEFRKNLSETMGSLKMNRMLHEKIIARLDSSGKMFKILMVKTPMTLPYTSVFINLDCGYWGDDAEKRLRKSMTK